MRWWLTYRLAKETAKDPKGRKALETYNKAASTLLAVILIGAVCLAVFLIWIVVRPSSLAEIPTEAPTAVPVRQSLPDPTAPPPTVDPQLMILYQDDDGSCLIKGNINSKGVKIYHLPGSSAYNSTKIDTKAGERWFCTEYDAIRAGWHAPGQ